MSVRYTGRRLKTKPRALAYVTVLGRALGTEHATAAKVQAQAGVEQDALLREAVALQGYEEARHSALLRSLLTHYAIPAPPALSGVGILRGKRHLNSSSQCVILAVLRPGLRYEAAQREAMLIEQRHQNGDPALAKDTHQAQLGGPPRAGRRARRRPPAARACSRESSPPPSRRR